MKRRAILIKSILLIVFVFCVVWQPVQKVEAKKITSMKEIIEDTIEIPMIFMFNSDYCDVKFSFNEQMKAFIGARVTYAEKQKQHFTVKCVKNRMKELFGSSEFYYINTNKNPFCMMRVKDSKVTYLSGSWGNLKPEYRILKIKKKEKGVYRCKIKAMLVDTVQSKVAFEPKYVEYTVEKVRNKYGYIIRDIDLLK